MKVCPFCAEDVKDAAIVCKHCGRDVPKQVASTRSNPGAQAVAGRPAQTSSRLKIVAFRAVIGLGVLAVIDLILVGLMVGPTTGSQPSNTSRSQSAFYAAMNHAVTVSRVIADFGQPDADDSTADNRPRPPMPVLILHYKHADVKVLFLADAQMGEPPPYKGWIFLGFADGSSKQALDSAEALRRLGCH